MTREEELEQAAYSQYCNSESICFTLMCDSFKQGAKWADNHPINVWHDVTEEPMDRRRTIVLYGTNPVGVTSCNYEDILLTFRETWSAYVFLSNFSLWAYLDELLPKGGEK